MKIHNILEDIVISKVEEIFDEEAKDRVLGFCTCRQCRLDVACYVLNRSEPQYVVSGRGYAHLKSEYDEDSQKTTDITALVLEGIKKVSHSKRPFFPHSGENDEYPEGGPFFNFPIIAGRIFDGKTFEPVSDIEVSLTSDGDLVPMKNPNWQNPYYVAESTAGTFMFWPGPVSAGSTGLQQTFQFRVATSSPVYD